MKTQSIDGITVHHVPRPSENVREEILAGLSGSPKRISSKYLYDAEGSKLFDAITDVADYYPTRTEISILESAVAEMVERLGEPSTLRLVEMGSGSSMKTRILLDALPGLAQYVPVDISEQHLLEAVRDLQVQYPGLDVEPVVADYSTDIELPEPGASVERTAVFYPGSSLGNFDKDQAARFLSMQARLAGTGGGMLLGVDLVKDVRTLERAYDDSEGVTGEFNLNLLRHINALVDANFDPSKFRHCAKYQADERRIEMQLISQEAQTVVVAGESVVFAAGEKLVTEHSHKYTDETIRTLLRGAGFAVNKTWTDPNKAFLILWCEVAPE